MYTAIEEGVEKVERYHCSGSEERWSLMVGGSIPSMRNLKEAQERKMQSYVGSVVPATVWNSDSTSVGKVEENEE